MWGIKIEIAGSSSLALDTNLPYDKGQAIYPLCAYFSLYKMGLTIFVECIDTLRAKLWCCCYTIKISSVKLNWSGSNCLRGWSTGIWNGKKQRGGYLADWYGNSWAKSQKVLFVAIWRVLLWDAVLSYLITFSPVEWMSLCTIRFSWIWEMMT